MQKPSIRYLHLAPENDLPALEGLTAFKAIVMVEAEVPEMTRWDVSRWLVESGCRYALAWGDQCDAWRESIDDASLEATDYEDCLLYTSPSPRDATLSRMPSSA